MDKPERELFKVVTEHEERKIQGVHDYFMAPRIQKNFWRRKFIESNDPTGYTFAEEWLEGGFAEWHKWCKGHAPRKDIPEWKETLSIKLQAQAIVNIAAQRDSFQASKWLADRGWEEKQDKRTKEAKKQDQRTRDAVEEDMERLGLKLVQKG